MTIAQLLTSFEGRISRSGFWIGMLCLCLIAAAFALVAHLAGIPVRSFDTEEELGTGGTILAVVEVAVLGYTQFALFAKRWHDRGKSGWWSLILFVPVIGFFWWLIECGMLQGDPGPNAYRPPPVGVRPQIA